MAAGPLSKKKPVTAFYEIPSSVRTSAQIIEDARRSVRLVPTSRPFTPVGGRTLFGISSSGRKSTLSRPPSVYRYLYVLYIYI